MGKKFNFKKQSYLTHKGEDEYGNGTGKNSKSDDFFSEKPF